MAESWSSALVREKQKREVVLSSCKHRWLRHHLNLCLSDIWSTRKSAARDMLFGMLEYDALLSCNKAVNETTLLRKSDQVQRNREALLQMVRDVHEYDMPL